MNKQQAINEIAHYLGIHPNEEAIGRAIYKNTDCGAWVKFEDTQIAVGSIVEGVDFDAQTRYVPYNLAPRLLKRAFSEAVEAVEKECDEIWKDTHGCEDCGTETETGYIPINPNCPSCEGHGTII